MADKGSDPPSFAEIDRWDAGFGWLAHPQEGMQRASHAVVSGGTDGERAVWLIDPLDAPGLDERLGELGEVVGVVCCLDRHTRDADVLARRHDVPVYVTEWMSGVADEVDAPIERFGVRLPDSEFEAITVRDSSIPPWQEVALFDGETLYVPEAVGTADFFLAGDERLGVHPTLRPFPPREVFRGMNPDRVLVGHGEGVFDDPARALRDALAGARRNAPSAYLRALKSLLG